MFVLNKLLEGPPISHGLALAFGPGLAAEGFGFRSAVEQPVRREAVEPELVDVVEREGVARDGAGDDAVGAHLGEVAHAAQQPVGDARGAARAARDLLRAVRERQQADGGWQVVATFYGTPEWALRGGVPGCGTERRPNLDAYRALVRSLRELAQQEGPEVVAGRGKG